MIHVMSKIIFEVIVTNNESINHLIQVNMLLRQLHTCHNCVISEFSDGKKTSVYLNVIAVWKIKLYFVVIPGANILTNDKDHGFTRRLLLPEEVQILPSGWVYENRRPKR